MGLEAATYIHQLNPAWPIGGVDPKAQGDENLRMLKSTLQATFPNIAGAMTVSHTALNQWGGLTAAYAWTGQHSWTQPLRAPNGSSGAPAYTFANDLDSGIYSVAADNYAFVTGGGIRLGLDSSSFTSLVQIINQNGTAATPAYSFHTDPDTGFYRVTSDVMGLSCGGVLRWNWGSFGARGPDGTAGAPAYAFDSDTDTGIYRYGANTIGFANAGAVSAYIFGNGSVGGIGVQNGDASNPTYTFINDTDTGMWRNGANGLAFSAGGVLQLYCDTISVIARQQLQGINGSAGTPSHAFESDTNTGLYLIGADQLGFSEGGTGYRIGFRQVPRSTTATTLAIGDVGKCVAVSAAINIPASVFSAGDCISIYNDSGSSVNITISAGTLRLAGTASTGTRALAARGMATLWFNVGGATPEVIASGAGVS